MVASILIALVISFYGGMQYQSYRIKQAMTAAFSDLGKAFGEGLSGNAVKTASTDTKPIDNKLNDKVLVELTGKDSTGTGYQTAITFKLKLTNKTDKVIKGVQGKLTFTDMFDSEIKSVNVSYDQGLSVGEVKDWDGSIDYNDFLTEDSKLKATDFASLKYVWTANTIVYQDGSKEVK